MATTTHSQKIMHWIGLSSVLRPRQHSIGYMGDGFYKSCNHQCMDRVNYAEAANCLCLCEWTHPAAIAAENSVLR